MAKKKTGVGPVLGSAGIAIAAPKEDRETVRIRKISNGYLICREICKNGSYKEVEMYSKTRPNIALPTGKGKP